MYVLTVMSCVVMQYYDNRNTEYNRRSEQFHHRNMASASNYAKTMYAIFHDRLWHMNGNSMDENSYSVQLGIILLMIRRAIQKYV